jgi:hypothetical protein
VRVLAIEVHVEAGLTQSAGLVLLEGLAPDEVLDVGVVDVEDDHLGGAACSATGLDRPRRRIRTTHERDRARCRPTRLQTLFRRTKLREVETGAGAVLEDDAFLDVPVEDRLHLVFDREDEAGADLLLAHGSPTDVEPNRRVESGFLVDQEVGELGFEDVGLGGIGEVATGQALVVIAVHYPIDHLLDRTLTVGRALGAPEVLLGGDVGGVLRPLLGDLDALLLEGDLAGSIVLDHRIAQLPLDLVVGMDPLGREEPMDRELVARSCADCGLGHRTPFFPHPLFNTRCCGFSSQSPLKTQYLEWHTRNYASVTQASSENPRYLPTGPRVAVAAW